MTKGLRLTLSVTEARLLADAVGRHDGAAAIAVELRRGLDQQHARGADQRAKRAADRARRAAEPTYRHFEVEGYRITTMQADWYDAGTDSDAPVWHRIRHDEPWRDIPAQTEHRPGWWMVYVWPIAGTDDGYGPLGERLIEHVANVDHAARAIIAEATA